MQFPQGSWVGPLQGAAMETALSAATQGRRELALVSHSLWRHQNHPFIVFEALKAMPKMCPWRYLFEPSQRPDPSSRDPSLTCCQICYMLSARPLGFRAGCWERAAFEVVFCSESEICYLKKARGILPSPTGAKAEPRMLPHLGKSIWLLGEMRGTTVCF